MSASDELGAAADKIGVGSEVIGDVRPDDRGNQRI